MNAPIVQGSPEWYALRCGKTTASEFSSVLAKGAGIVRAKYLRQVVAERLSGKSHVGYHNGHMDRGQEQEAAARRAYEISTGYIVEQVGFVEHPRVPMVGCSPDGLVGTDGGCEIKCVLPHIQLDTILREDMPPEHRAQVQGSMWITGRQWWDFVSYCPDMPEHLQLVRYTVERDDDYIANLSAEVAKFNREVDALFASLMRRGQ